MMADRGQHSAAAAAAAAAREPARRYETNEFDRLDDALRDWAARGGAAAAADAGVGAAGAARPQVLGRYRIVELIGEGGMGAVYQAEQLTPVRRTVAIKLIKPGLDSREVLARFEAERQALARMDHPHIAKVLDAGADELGRPYFVMEHVPGTPLARFCDERRLPLRARLELFCQACEAIAHAHAKAIIHRDVKSSNVLAYLQDGRPVVKVIDFGVAKALSGDRLTDVTFSTDRGSIIGTYDSMSPEQADGSRDIDTRTDVYALGVLLYELLVGAKPFDRATLATAPDHEVRRIIREVEPPRPSAKLASMRGDALSAVAAARQAKPETLVRELRRELEWIPLMAIRKERERRYPSPQALGDDIRNYLAGRPLTAGPESRSYVAKKFVARHRSIVIGVAIGIVLVTAASGFYLHRIRAEQARTLAALKHAQEQTALAERERRRAELEGAVATNVKDFLADMLRALNPARARGREVRLEDVVRESAKRVERQFKDQPDVEAQLRTELGETLMAIGHADEALPHFRRAHELHRSLSGPESKPALRSAGRAGWAMVDLGQYREAEEIYRATVTRCRALLAPDDPVRLQAEYKLGHLLSLTRRTEESEQLLRAVYEQRLRMSGPDVGPDGIETLRTASTLGLVVRRLGDGEEAEALLRGALERRLKMSTGEDDPDISKLQNNLASYLTSVGRDDEARDLTRESLAMARRIYPEGHPDLVSTITNYGRLLQDARRSTEAEDLVREAYTTGLKALGADHPVTIQAELILQRVLAESGRAEEALALTRDALERRRRLHGPDDPETLDAMRALTSTLMRARQHDEAIRVIGEMVAGARRTYGDEHRETMVAMAHQAGYLKDARRFAEAEPVYAEIVRLARAHPGYMTPAQIAQYGTARALMIKEQGRLREAKPLLEASLAELRRAGLPPGDRNTRNCLLALAAIADAEGETARAAELRAHASPATAPSTAPAND